MTKHYASRKVFVRFKSNDVCERAHCVPMRVSIISLFLPSIQLQREDAETHFAPCGHEWGPCSMSPPMGAIPLKNSSQASVPTKGAVWDTTSSQNDTRLRTRVLLDSSSLQWLGKLKKVTWIFLPCFICLSITVIFLTLSSSCYSYLEDHVVP